MGLSRHLNLGQIKVTSSNQWQQCLFRTIMCRTPRTAAWRCVRKFWRVRMLRHLEGRKLQRAQPVANCTAGAWARPANQSSWGGSVVLDPATGTFHMFAADMTDHCGLNSWQHYSAIAHLVSASAVAGPYTQASATPVLPPFAHNPTVHLGADSTWLLYHIGTGTPSAGRPLITNCRNGTTPAALLPAGSEAAGASSCGSHDDFAPSLLTSKSPDGIWEAAAFPGGGDGCNNPAAFVFGNGTTLLVCKVDDASAGGIHTMQVAVAKTWRGPYRKVGPPTQVHGEDAYIFQQPEDGSLHMLLHAMHPHKVCTTAWSTDGVHWTPAFVENRNTTAGEVYPSFDNSAIATEGGGSFRTCRCERHQVLTDASGAPVRLFNGVTTGDGDFSFTFTAGRRPAHSQFSVIIMWRIQKLDHRPAAAAPSAASTTYAAGRACVRLYADHLSSSGQFYSRHVMINAFSSDTSSGQ